jgi:hypothetical protein
VLNDATGAAIATTATTNLMSVFIPPFYQCTLRMADEIINRGQIERDRRVECIAEPLESAHADRHMRRFDCQSDRVGTSER